MLLMLVRAVTTGRVYDKDLHNNHPDLPSNPLESAKYLARLKRHDPALHRQISASLYRTKSGNPEEYRAHIKLLSAGVAMSVLAAFLIVA